MHHRSWLFGLLAGLTILFAAAAFALVHPERTPAPVAGLVEDLTGANPHPVRLVLPPKAPLSALALLGRRIFFDASLSESGRQSCASCHSPEHAYGPPNAQPVQLGGPHMGDSGFRPPPSLAYLYRQQPFSIGPDVEETDTPTPINQTASSARGAARAVKVAGVAPAAPAIVPQGGLFWDGRSDTLQIQSLGPMMNAVEMGNSDVLEVARKLAHASYRNLFTPLFGNNIFDKPELLVSEAMSAVSRYQIEDVSFHAFDSKYDDWLQGEVRLTPAELRGLRLFNDPAKANCAGCHLSRVSPDGLPPLFTDTQYEALGVPRNPAIPANRDPRFFDLGLCGPFRTDLAKQTQYCGMFLTPTLRNSAKRAVYFHNGVYKSLRQVLYFYNRRDVDPEKIYPRDAKGAVRKYNDIPAVFRTNVDVADAPFDRKRGDRPAMTDPEIADIIAFLRTLNDR